MGTYRPPTKTVKDVADYVKRAFGDESGVQVTDFDVIRWVNSAQHEIISSNNILKGTATVAVVVGQDTFPMLGTDFSIQNIHSLKFNGITLKHYSFVDAEKYIQDQDPQDTQEGLPSLWYEWGGTISIYPRPARGGTLTAFFTRLPETVTELVDKLSVPDLYFNRVVDYVLAQAYEMDENFNAAQAKMDSFDSRLVGMSNDEDAPPINTYPMMTIMPEDL